MPVPFEALIPYAIIVTMFGVTGAGLSAIKTAQNGGKKARWSLDTWDRRLTIGAFIVMDRDRRLTGWLRGQTDAADAPYGFEYNNPWRVGYFTGRTVKRIIERTRLTNDITTTRTDDHLPLRSTISIRRPIIFGPYQPCGKTERLDTG
ncbi:hypothetical protein QR685DRAFT_572460 [Neurospora intermedia]|uniref:NADH dehydrogenase [ubiquinone] 1 alpha subcomplex subunit 1 n=1 Tax=Neurospora intermedia TaxID=5142 RepID=A0ABR3D9U6_NEUIN